MRKSARAKAEQMFAASQKKSDEYRKQKEKAEQESDAQIAKLKALRLAKEAAEKKTAEKAD